jgi:hypothetical protein
LVDALGFLLAAGGLLTASYSRSLYYSMTLRFNPDLGIAIPFLDFIVINFARSFKAQKVASYLKLKLPSFSERYLYL